MTIGQGPLSVDDLLTIWESSVDDGYSGPLVAAGEGAGLEAYTQGFAQLSRVSSAIDVTMQSLYILPWSGQTNAPASNEQRATVLLSISRNGAGRSDLPVRVGAGQVFFQEEATDWGDSGPSPALTGRRYTLVQDLVLMPGDNGPVSVEAVAERGGYGYNNPLPGTIVAIDQTGALFQNVGASVSVATVATPPYLKVSITTPNTADTFLPDHVGQYVFLSTGANAGVAARIIGFQPPVPPSQGSTVQLEPLCVVEVFSALGVFTAGETVNIKNGATLMATAVFVEQTSTTSGHTRVAVVMNANVAVLKGWTVTGTTSGVTGTIGSVLYDPVFVNSSGNTAWVVVGWTSFFGLQSTNAASPTGGTLDMLGAIGYDRGLPQNVGEGTEAYRQRVHQIADVVTPNAIRRMLNRVLGNSNWCFRETGSELLPGFFADRDASDVNVLLFTGNYASSPPSFTDPLATASFQEKLELRDSSGNVKARGFMGAIGSHALTFIPTDGAGSRDQPYIFASGDLIVSLLSGARFTVTGITANVQYPLHRYRVDLDYVDFRAFFLISLPAENSGDFGISYDNSPDGFYDSSQLLNFYDGFAVGSSMLYKRLWQALDSIRAGGVSFDFDVAMTPCS